MALRLKATNLLGPEPVFTGPIESDANPELIKAHRWYQEYVTRSRNKRGRREEIFGWLISWMRESKKFSAEELRTLSARFTPISFGASARLVSNGAPFTPALIESFVASVKKLIESEKARVQKKPDQFSKKPTVLDHTRETISNLIGVFEGAFDDTVIASKEGFQFSAFSYLTQEGTKPAIARAIIKKFKPVLEELELSRSDSELRSAYPDRAQVNRGVAWIKQVLEETERYCSLNSIRAPRKKKEKSAAKLVGRMLYLREHRDMQLTSIDPTGIVGAASLWVFNVKTRRLTAYHAKNSDGLTVSGSSIKNFDSEVSQTKTLRKPDEVITQLLSVSKGNSGKIMSALKTKKSTPNGRINRDTVLLRALR